MCFYHPYVVVVVSGILPVKSAVDINVCVCVCVRERERARERGGVSQRESENEVTASVHYDN
jgi:hypothetical protein